MKCLLTKQYFTSKDGVSVVPVSVPSDKKYQTSSTMSEIKKWGRKNTSWIAYSVYQSGVRRRGDVLYKTYLVAFKDPESILAFKLAFGEAVGNFIMWGARVEFNVWYDNDVEK